MRILVAEDEADIRNLVKISLEDSGYEVVEAENGKEAYDKFLSGDIGLAILDVMMPVTDGFNLLKKIREKSTIPVIMLTARADDMDKVLGLGLGADDYIAKPFSVAELIAIFNPFVRGGEARSPKSGGSGLGLSIAQKIAKAHGGDLILCKNRAKGSVFELTIPTI